MTEQHQLSAEVSRRVCSASNEVPPTAAESGPHAARGESSTRIVDVGLRHWPGCGQLGYPVP